MLLSEQLENLLDRSTLLDLVCEGVKPPYGFPAGKIKMAQEMVDVIPDHKIYVEPFAGSGAVFFAKDPADKEVLNDLDPQVAQTLRDLKGLSQADIQRLINKDWVANPAKYEQLFDSKPTSPVERLYRFLYLARWSHSSNRLKRGFAKTDAGKDCRGYIEKRLADAVARLKGATIASKDYEQVIKEHDSPNAFFFLDPPYAQYNNLKNVDSKVKTGEGDFDEERFMNVLKGIKGKWFLNYGERGELPKMLKQNGFQTRIVYRNNHNHFSKDSKVGHLVASNYNANLSKISSR